MVLFSFSFLSSSRLLATCIGIPVLSFSALYAYTRATCGRFSPRYWPNLLGKVAVITGSNVGVFLLNFCFVIPFLLPLLFIKLLHYAGIGYQTAKVFARLGATVILACRSSERGETARTKLICELSADPATVDAASLSKRILFMPLDLVSFTSIREFVNAFTTTHGHLDLLVNNAGVMCMPFLCIIKAKDT